MAHPADPDPDLIREIERWWSERREGPKGQWEVPFPPRPDETARVLRVAPSAGTGDPEIWRAALFHRGALTAYMEVESTNSAEAALRSLYEHVRPGGELHSD